MASSGDVMRGSDFHSSNIASEFMIAHVHSDIRWARMTTELRLTFRKGTHIYLEMAFKLTLSP